MSKDTRPNVILIVADQWRGDCLGIAGHPDVHTPMLDTLAQKGILYDRAYTATPTCIAARAALLTGQKQDNHCRVGYSDGVDWEYGHTVAGEFAKNGYYCYCAGKMHVYPTRRMMGYHSIDLHDGYLHFGHKREQRPFGDHQLQNDDYFHWLSTALSGGANILDTGVGCNSWLTRPWPYEERLHPTVWATDRALDFLRKRDRDMPFFMTLSYVRPHPPLDAPACFYDMYKDRALRAPVVGDWADLSHADAEGRVFDSEYAPSDRHQQQMTMAGYYACMTQIDYQLGRLYEMLGEYGLLDNTVIMFTSDHGEMLFDHGLWRKSLPYEGSAHVPMILSGPQKYIGKTGVRDHRMTELRDVMPTLLSIAGIEIPDSVDGQNMLGQDSREFIHVEHVRKRRNVHAIVTATDKFIWYSNSDREEYFDLASDPTELHNAVSDPAYRDRVALLRRALVEELAWREEGFVRDGALAKDGALCYPVLKESLRQYCARHGIPYADRTRLPASSEGQARSEA